MSRIGEDVSERLDAIPPSSGCWSRGARNTPAAVARKLSRRPMPPSMSCPAGCPRNSSSPGLSSRSSVTTCRLSAGRDSPSGKSGIDWILADTGNWVGRACFHLMPVINQMRAHLRGADRIFVDETRAPVLEPGLKRTKSGFSGPSYPMIAAMAGLAHPSGLRLCPWPG